MRDTDWNVVGIDSFNHVGISERVAHWWEENLTWRSRTWIYTHDLTTPISDLLKLKIGHVDYVINLASMSDVFKSIQDPVPFVKNNVAVALTMLEFARATKPKAFLQVSTDEVYGPVNGMSLIPHKEWAPIVPSSPYSASKAAQEAIAIAYWRTYSVPLILVNLMNNFGEMQSPSKFPAIVQRKVAAKEVVTVHGNSDEQGSRSYIHSSNTASAFLFLLKHTVPHMHWEGQADRPDRYNIPGDVTLTNEDVVHTIACAMREGYMLQHEPFSDTRPGHDRHYGLDGSKLRNLGWRSPRTFQDTMERTVAWQKEHPEWLQASKS